MSNRKPQAGRGRRTVTAVLSHALVAAIALGAGFWAKEHVTAEPPPATSVTLASTGIIPPTSPLHEALEELPSGAERLIEPDLVVKPVLSYGALSGVWCRRFELRASTGRTEAVACRGEEVWRIAALTTGPNVEETEFDDVFNPKQENVVIEAAVAATIDGEVLEVQDELVLIVKGWEPGVVEI